MINKKYKVSASHEKGYDLGFETIFLTEEGLKSFIAQFEEKSKGLFFIEKTDTGYTIETHTYIVIEEYKEPTFLNSIDIDEVSFSDEGHESTWLRIE